MAIQKVISKETLLEQRRQQTAKERVEFTINGETYTVEKELISGEMVTYELDLTLYATPKSIGQGAIGEMLTTPQGLYDFVQKTVIDVEAGREAVPLLYGPIYQTTNDPNLSQYVDIAPFIYSRVVFLEHMELGEVRMGDRYIGPKDTVPIITWAAGFEYTEDMVEYDKTWEITELNRAMGEGYNMLLNHIHLYPIISYNYPDKNKTQAVTDSSLRYIERLRATLRNALVHQSQDRHPHTRRPRRGNILLAHSSKRWDIEEALARMVIGGTEYPALAGIDTLILYDGDAVTVGNKTYEYQGVDPSKAYLIDPSRYFRSLVKHGLRVDAQQGDLKRLIERIIVGRARIGVVASPEHAVEEITLPTTA